jgi:hypothetical protein
MGCRIIEHRYASGKFLGRSLVDPREQTHTKPVLKTEPQPGSLNDEEEAG